MALELGLTIQTIRPKEQMTICLQLCNTHEWSKNTYCRERRVVGPLNPAILPHAQISQFRVIPKKNGQWHLIVDLSSPQPDIVNDGINRDWCATSYVKVEDAARVISQLGRGTNLAKVDIKSAYHIVPVHPDDHPLLGMMWEGNLFVDRALSLWSKISS